MLSHLSRTNRDNECEICGKVNHLETAGKHVCLELEKSLEIHIQYFQIQIMFDKNFSALWGQTF